MDAFNKMAKLLKDRDNPNKLGIILGEVVQVGADKCSNVKISLLEGQAFITDFYTVINIFEKGDKVVLSVSEDNQTFYCLGKAIKKGGA